MHDNKLRDITIADVISVDAQTTDKPTNRSEKHKAILEPAGQMLHMRPAGNYSFIFHIASTDLTPDILCWENNSKKLQLVELKVQNAAERKEPSYEDLVHRE